MIRECVVSTISRTGRAHLAPLGLIEEPGGWIAAPFVPSTTLDNLRAVPELVANYVDDVRVIAGCLTSRRDWPFEPSQRVMPPRLKAAIAHAELAVVSVEEHELRPRFHCRVLHRANHAPFQGFNRAQGAVVELAILVSRLHMLPREKVECEIAYLALAVEKTAGLAEWEAWGWLTEAVKKFYQA